MTTEPDDLLRIRAACARTGAIALMEVCGTHTVSLLRSGIRSLLPDNLRLISGPGCPVCVTAQGYIDAALELAARPEITLCTFGDMVRVPGRRDSLAEARAAGARVVVVYGAKDAVAYATAHPDEEVVFLGIGFETTAPGTALAVLEAEATDLANFSVLVAHKLVIPAMRALLSGEERVPLDGFLCPGHVSVIIGSEAYRPLVDRFGVACVVAGFEPANMLAGLGELAELAADCRSGLANVYGAAVSPEGRPEALAYLDRVFAPGDAVWRALGTIPASGLVLRPAYARYDASQRYGVDIDTDYEVAGCRCGEVIQGRLDPPACPLFRTACTPRSPVGPCMVSSEGTCAAWYKYA